MPTEQGGIPIIYAYVLIFIIFYFLVIKPQKKKKKDQKDMLSNLKKHDEVISSGGIHGTIVLVKEKSIIVRVDDNVKIEFDKESITSVTKTKNPSPENK